MEAPARSSEVPPPRGGFDPGAGERPELPVPAWGLLAGFIAVAVTAWLVTVYTSSDLFQLVGAQLAGASPLDRLDFLALVGVMMVAMMLPAALPMVAVYRGLSSTPATPREGDLRATLFSLGYFLVWAAATSVGLVVLMLLGLMGSLSFPYALVPGLLLVAAGAYQFTTWKQYCLSNCRTPLGFLMTNWRDGRSGALRMGLDHSLYCIGCCWLLMGVVFVTGAMSLLWMGAFSGLIMVEKLWSRGEWFSRLLGGAAILVGAAITALAFLPTSY